MRLKILLFELYKIYITLLKSEQKWIAANLFYAMENNTLYSSEKHKLTMESNHWIYAGQINDAIYEYS